MARRQVTVRFFGDTYQRVMYLRRELRKRRRTKVSVQSVITDAIVAGLNAMKVPKFPGEVDEDTELD